MFVVIDLLMSIKKFTYRLLLKNYHGYRIVVKKAYQPISVEKKVFIFRSFRACPGVQYFKLDSRLRDCVVIRKNVIPNVWEESYRIEYITKRFLALRGIMS
jgi:hypothetical protein